MLNSDVIQSFGQPTPFILRSLKGIVHGSVRTLRSIGHGVRNVGCDEPRDTIEIPHSVHFSNHYYGLHRYDDDGDDDDHYRL